jgi:hypothetical protein
MEAAALAGLLGVGYVVSRLAGGKPKKTVKTKEGFTAPQPLAQDPYPKAGEYPTTMKPGSYTVALKSPPTSALALTPQGASAVAPSPELDQMYTTPNGRTYPSEPSPGPYGMPVGYATQRPPLAPPNPSPLPGPAQSTLEDSTAQVQMNPAGIKANPTYLDGPVVSSLTGTTIPADQFTHNNMVPFFGGRVKQNMRAAANNSLLDTYTGAGYTQIAKKEVETMFDYQRPFGNPFGLESSTDFIESRINTPRARNGERPFEPTRVGPAVGEEYGMTGKGGFQQFEVNEIMRPRTTDQLRTADNPKLSYNAPVVPGSRFVTNPADNPGEVRHYRPDRFYIDPTLSRAGIAGPTDHVKETSRPVQVLPETMRTTTTTEAFGPAASQDAQSSYIVGSYRTPMTQTFGGAGFRNADSTAWYTPNVDSPEADYGRSGYENRPTERSATGERTMALNTSPADTGQVSVHYLDEARPTRRAEQEDGHTEFGAGYIAGGAPSVTVWDPNDVARTTVKETTIKWDYRGVASAADAPNRLKVYDPNDIARPTQKAQLSNRQYYGSGNNPGWGYMNEDFAYNMRTNPNKEQIARGRKPIYGNGGIAIFEGDPGKQTAKRLVSDDVNDRVNSIGRVVESGPGVGDLGLVKYRVPLRLDVAAERNTPDIVEAVDDNPLQQSLHRIANIAAKQDAMSKSRLAGKAY